MSKKIDGHLTQLLTGDPETDDLLRQAFQIGLKVGTVHDRKSLIKDAQIDTTTRMLTALIRSRQVTLEDAFLMFGIPKIERNTYRRIIKYRSPEFYK